MRAGPEQLDDVRQVYLTLHDHHAALTPTAAGATVRDRDESWRRRRARYVEWLSSPGGFFLLAASGEQPVGYAIVSLGPGLQTWASGERIGDIHDIAVLPELRGRGVGTRLMERIDRELAATGVKERRLTVLASNRDAVRFYERQQMELTTYVMFGLVQQDRR